MRLLSLSALPWGAARLAHSFDSLAASSVGVLLALRFLSEAAASAAAVVAAFSGVTGPSPFFGHSLVWSLAICLKRLPCPFTDNPSPSLLSLSLSFSQLPRRCCTTPYRPLIASRIGRILYLQPDYRSATARHCYPYPTHWSHSRQSTPIDGVKTKAAVTPFDSVNVSCKAVWRLPACCPASITQLIPP